MSSAKRSVTQKHRVSSDVHIAIEDLMSDYAYALDDDALERWPKFFTEDATYKIISRDNYDAGMPLGIMSCDGQGMMQDRILALRTANVFEPHTYCHLLGPTRIEFDDDMYRARTNFSVIRTMQDGASTRYATGKYIDECVMDAGVARLQSRTVVLESRRIDVLLVIPL
jgi:anthranilate 1,2-dioxygenase small subunit